MLVTQAIAAAPDYSRDILPILEARCLSCHGPKLQMHGFRLDRKADALKGANRACLPSSPATAAAWFEQQVACRVSLELNTLPWRTQFIDYLKRRPL